MPSLIGAKRPPVASTTCSCAAAFSSSRPRPPRAPTQRQLRQKKLAGREEEGRIGGGGAPPNIRGGATCLTSSEGDDMLALKSCVGWRPEPRLVPVNKATTRKTMATTAAPSRSPETGGTKIVRYM